MRPDYFGHWLLYYYYCHNKKHNNNKKFSKIVTKPIKVSIIDDNLEYNDNQNNDNCNNSKNNKNNNNENINDDDVSTTIRMRALEHTHTHIHTREHTYTRIIYARKCRMLVQNHIFGICYIHVRICSYTARRKCRKLDRVW